MDNTINKKSTIVELNILRALMGVCIFLYHAYYNMDCRYGRIVDPVITQCSFFMTLFFMLSGYVLFYSNMDTDFSNPYIRKEFYKKRIMRLYPLYFLVWLVFYFYDWKVSTVKQDIITFPLQLLLLQNSSHYDYLMNSGTWFFSCMMICYLLFPLIKPFVYDMQLKQVRISMVITVWLISTYPLLSYLYATESYQNPFGRVFEFMLGALIARRVSLRNERGRIVRFEKISGIVGIVLICVSFIAIWKLNTTVDKIIRNQEFFKILSAIIGGTILYCFSINKNKIVTLFADTKCIRFLSSIAFEFWIATFFTTEIYKKLIKEYVQVNPYLHIISTILINLVLAVFLKQISLYINKQSQRISLFKMFCVVASVFVVLFIIKAFLPGGLS